MLEFSFIQILVIFVQSLLYYFTVLLFHYFPSLAHVSANAPIPYIRPKMTPKGKYIYPA